jgi:hypothetical protein
MAVKIVKAYRGRKLVYRSEFSDVAKIGSLVQTWRRHCRVTVIQTYPARDKQENH